MGNQACGGESNEAPDEAILKANYKQIAAHFYKKAKRSNDPYFGESYTVDLKTNKNFHVVLKDINTNSQKD